MSTRSRSTTRHASRGLRRRRALLAAGAVLALLIGGGAVARAVEGGGGDAVAGPVARSTLTATPAPASPTSGPTRSPAVSPAPTAPRPSTPSRRPTPHRTSATKTSATKTSGPTPPTTGTDDEGDGVDTVHLTPALGRALRAATTAAQRDGVRIRVVSGYRTPAHQQRLYEQAIRTYGSARLARRWVLPPAESAHVRGEAVDVGPRSAATWLQSHGSTWGLCRRYDNEWWHFEVATTPGGRCPPRAPHA